MRRRLILSYVSITMLVLVVLSVPLGFAFARSERDGLRSDIQHDAFVLALRSEEALENAPSVAHETLQPLAEQYQRDHGGRVVFVDANGSLVADSEPPDLGAGPTTDLGRDFSSRPEIRRALTGREVTGQRRSDTLGADLLFVAVPIASGGELHGVVRVTYPLSFVNDRANDVWLVLAAIGGVVLAIVLLVSIVLARSITRPLAALERGAQALGQGDLGTRVVVPDGPPELQSLARSFNQTGTELERLVAAQQEFVADASHQLRTPLAALRLRLENLEMDTADAAQEDLRGAVDEVGRLSALVDGLLELARVSQIESRPQTIEVGAMLRARRDAWEALASERDVSLRVAAAEVAARVTSGRLEQVVDNLLNNALEVAPAGSAISMTAEPSGPSIRIVIADEGPGMSEEQRSRAFDRFWHEGSGGGFGLGLAIVRQLVESDGGQVVLAAAPSGGLEVSISVPAARGVPVR